MTITSGEPLISWTEKGLYCAAGDFFIDPHRAVDTAIVTHAHSDHARRGSKRYFCAKSSVGLLKQRLGQKIQAHGVPYGEILCFGEVEVSLHPAGHILGSAQVRVQRGNEVWVASGDYKRDPDPSCEPFESVRCDTFITEATFGTPKYRWEKNRPHGKDIYEWWMGNVEKGVNSLLFGYSLGKAQRILAELAPLATRPVLLHESAVELSECYRAEGRKLAPTRSMASIDPSEKLRGELLLAPPSILKTDWEQRLGEYETAFASGWMQGASYYGASYDRGFVMSDHADWDDLNRTIDESGAKRVFVLHRNGALIRHLRKRGIEAHPGEALEPAKYARFVPSNLSLFPELGGL